MLLCRFMEQITKYLLCSILQTSWMPFSSIWHLCDLPPLPFIYPQFVHQCRRTERFLPQTVDPSGLILPTPELSQELHPYTVQYVDTAQILPSWVNWAKTPSNLLTALPRDLFIQFEPGDIPICAKFKRSTPIKSENMKLTFLHAVISQHHQYQGNKRVWVTTYYMKYWLTVLTRKFTSCFSFPWNSLPCIYF